MFGADGPWSRKKPNGVNPSIFRDPDPQPIDRIINPVVTTRNLLEGNLENLYSSKMSQFRQVNRDISLQAISDLADHYNDHIKNNTFGTSSTDPAIARQGLENLFVHQELMYQGMLASMTFLESHKYALRNGPKPIN